MREKKKNKGLLVGLKVIFIFFTINKLKITMSINFYKLSGMNCKRYLLLTQILIILILNLF